MLVFQMDGKGLCNIHYHYFCLLLTTYLFIIGLFNRVSPSPSAYYQNSRQRIPFSPTLYVFKILAATKIAALVFCTHSCANSASSSNVILSVIPGNVTGAYPVSRPGAKIVCW
jgi:hypothetical protein